MSNVAVMLSTADARYVCMYVCMYICTYVISQSLIMLGFSLMNDDHRHHNDDDCRGAGDLRRRCMDYILANFSRVIGR